MCILCDKNTEYSEVNILRQHLFSTKMKLVENLPPTQATFKYHLLRSLHQARIWAQMDCKNINVFDPALYGWNRFNDQWKPIWTDLPAIGQSRLFIKCACKNCKSTRGRGSSCSNEGLPCYSGCGCQGKCEEQQ